jgi:hypothetical protein
MSPAVRLSNGFLGTISIKVSMMLGRLLAISRLFIVSPWYDSRSWAFVVSLRPAPGLKIPASTSPTVMAIAVVMR